MKKAIGKLISVILCLTMLLSAGTMLVNAEEGTDIMYATKGSLSVDGASAASLGDSAEMLTPDVRIGTNMYAGASWDESTKKVYLMIVSLSNGLSEVSINIGGKTTTFQRNGSENTDIPGSEYSFGPYGYLNVTELSFPMMQLSFVKVDDGTVYADLSLTATGSSGIGSFNGKLYFTANKSFLNDSLLGQKTNDGTTQKVWGGVSSSSGVKTLTAGKSGIYNKVVSLQSNIEAVVQMNMTVASLPEVDSLDNIVAETGAGAENPARIRLRLNKGMKDGSTTNPAFCLITSIYNVKDKGLVLVRYNGHDLTEAGIELGKQLNESFTLTVQWNADYSAQVWVDGTAVGVFPKLSAAYMKPWHGNTFNSMSWGVYIEALAGSTADATISCSYYGLSLSNHTALDADAFLALATPAPVEYYGQQETAIADGKYSVRFVSIIPSIDYVSAGYEITMSYVDREGKTKTSEVQDIPVTKAFSSLLAAGETVYAPEGYWFTVAAITNIPVSNGNMTFTVRPYVIETDGAERTYATEQVIEYDASTGKPLEAGA